jgi:hypothetical protein
MMRFTKQIGHNKYVLSKSGEFERQVILVGKAIHKQTSKPLLGDLQVRLNMPGFTAKSNRRGEFYVSCDLECLNATGGNVQTGSSSSVDLQIVLEAPGMQRLVQETKVTRNDNKAPRIEFFLEASGP